MRTLLLCAWCLISAFSITAQEKFIEPDTWVSDILDRKNLDYQLIESNESEFRIETNLGNGRSQGGFIDSKLSKFNGIELRDILSLVLVSETMPTRDQMYMILASNEQLKMGYFEMFHNGNDYVVRYKCRVPAYLNPDDLIDIYYYGITVADELEGLITEGKDVE